MAPSSYHLNQTVSSLSGASKEQIIVFNQWAAVALNKYHANSSTEMLFNVNKEKFLATLFWESNFVSDAMIERRKMAEEGGVSMAFFIMSVILDFKHVMQTEIGEGVDYRFKKEVPTNENFLSESHFVEVSGLLEENGSNTLINRVAFKHKQIDKGTLSGESSSVIITLFNSPMIIKEVHA